MSSDNHPNNISGKPEAIVRPLRRRENSQESSKQSLTSDQQSINEKVNKENSKKPQTRRAIFRESKKNSRDVSTSKRHDIVKTSL